MEIGSFDVLIKQQLEPVWYRVSSKTKLIVNDLTTLRKLLDYLKPSLQVKLPLLLYHNNTIFSVRKDVYSFGIQTVLEELPKWNLLAEILREIESDITSHATETSRTSSERGDLSHLNNTILIRMENERECSQLMDGMSKVSKNLFNENGKERSKAVNSNSGKGMNNQRGTFQRGQQPPNKRRCVPNFINSNQTILPEVPTAVTFSTNTSSNNSSSTSCYDDEFDVEAFSTYFGLLGLRNLIIIRPINGEEVDRVLHPNILLFIILTKLLLEVLKNIELYILIYHVKEKSIMVIFLGRPLRIINNQDESLNINTRIADYNRCNRMDNE
ncbi:unnamed protein product [Rhizophagus irregularis]|nr:unnamed protein product [Rhizophagus irregularis]